jgi:BTB/POZ domain
LIVVFKSGFSEGSEPITHNSNQCPRRIIVSIERFELLHAILYYLYTDKVLFGADSAIAENLRMPACDAEELFAIAHRFDIPKLREKAVNFIIDSCDAKNIIPHVFGEFAQTYKEVGEAYAKVFHRHWNEIRTSKELDELLEGLEDEDADRRTTIVRKYRELTRELQCMVTPT